MIRDWASSHGGLILTTCVAAAVLLTLTLLFVPLLAGIIGAVGLWSLAAVALVWKNWESCENASGRLLGFVSFVGGRPERIALSAELQGMINGARNEIRRRSPMRCLSRRESSSFGTTPTSPT